ncbi:MAG: hypothetical protein ACFE9L_00730, partial [Candidatus Hodarchaeota archaeon]
MSLSLSDIKRAIITFEYPQSEKYKLPLEEELYYPINKILTEMDLFSFLKKWSYSAAIETTTSRGTNTVSPYGFLREISED